MSICVLKNGCVFVSKD